IIAGWTFGLRLGFPAVVIGTVGGAALCYLAARWLAADRVHTLFASHPKWDVVRRALAEEKPLKTLWIVFLMRLSPVLPFGTTNVLMATTGVPLHLYLLGTVLGLVPRLGIVAAAAAAARAERLDFNRAESWWMLAAGLAATGVCVLVLAVAGRHALRRATRGDENDKVNR
ncbi:MAG: VTT domain-containing protein, partial [Tepidisphaeraceae bacterium]